MANHTSEHPEGHLGPEVLKSFFSVTEDAYGNFKYEYGHERIPDNWYRRAVGDEYNIPFFLGDLEAAARKHPEFLSIGGNTGKVNSFVGVDPTNPSGSVFNAKNLAEGNNFFCYFFSLMQASPNANEYLQIHPIESATEHFSQFSSFASRFNCPQRERLDPDAFDKYPGFTRIGFPDPGVFGLGRDIAGFLTALAIVTAGAIVNGTAMVSIGKATPQVHAQSYEPSGLSGTHNKYESDASPMKGDLYQYKDADKLVLTQLENFLNRSKTNDYTLRDLFDFRSYRIDESLRDNCYCYFGLISFNIIAAGSHTFIYWLMSNKSKERPRGRLTEEDILSWYKRAIGDEYTIPLFVKDVLVGASIYPKFFALGGNINCSFVGLRAENLTGGVYNFETLSEGNNFYCFLLLTSLQLPDFFQGAGKEFAKLASFFAAFVNNSTLLRYKKVGEEDKVKRTRNPLL
ncbi:unnamed protein product [Bemisia tabaci]|uniref:Uncharacterized protein n=1 Tax=Bemisia tabaci TaxID=7038 RepID=A0A9P0F955_BEMTA|nr:unnamed protein product [Bemisia tabaci]